MAYPGERQTLERIAQRTYDEHHKYIGTAKVIDTIDRALAVLTGIGEYVPAIGTLFRWGENTAELIPKAMYALWFAHGTKDHASLLYFAGMEALSYTPFAGTIVDMMNLYLNRARLTYRNTVAQRFITTFLSKAERQTLRQDPTPGEYIDAEVVPPRRQLPGAPPAPRNDVERAIASIRVIPERDGTTTHSRR